MKIRVPEYFLSFRCIADKCRDSCCIGWEIDVDEQTRAKYASLECDLGREIAEKTSHGCFPLTENGRCSFLDERGLCRIISTLGEGYLCDICREHPRYYGVGDGVIDGGLGLGCEEAARIILSLKELPCLIEIEKDVHYSDEDEYASVSESLREALFSKIFTLDIHTLVGAYIDCAALADEMAFTVSTGGEYTEPYELDERKATNDELSELYDSFLALVSECEPLTEDWDDLVARVRAHETKNALNTLDTSRGLLYYFTHRYVREGVEDMSLSRRIILAIGSALAVAALSELLDGDEPIVLAAVEYSKNIEYSTDNVDYILENIEIM